MSAPLSEQLFHGTPHAFKPGEIVKPHDSALGHGAFATSKPIISDIFASSATRLRRGKQGHLFGMVYEVEPIKGDETFREAGTYAYRSDKGFKIKGLHHFVPGNFEFDDQS
jgi:hypothetical protein